MSTFSSAAQSFCGIAHLGRAVVLCAILSHCGPPAWTGGIHAQLAWSPRGVRVIDVRGDGSAAKAGLLPDDRLIAIDGKPIAGLTDLQVQERLAGEVGSFVTLKVLRDGSQIELKIERLPYERDKRD